LSVDAGGSITIQGMPQVWKPFTPASDGQSVLKGRQITLAQCNGTVLAVKSCRNDGMDRKLHLYRGQRGQAVGEHGFRNMDDVFMLAPVGQQLAVRTGTARVTVYDLAGGLQPIWHSPVSRCHSDMQVEVGDRWLVVQVGKFVHFFRWDGGRLLHRFTRGSKEALLKQELADTAMFGTGRQVQTRYSQSQYLLARFQKHLRSDHSALPPNWVSVDELSQVAILDRNGPVCLLYIFRERWAAWLPDGTRLGPSTITGGPETPNAAERIGRALLAAVSDASQKR
jgi:hypothetical protein